MDGKKLDYMVMTDTELKENQKMTYSFKFMETKADQE